MAVVTILGWTLPAQRTITPVEHLVQRHLERCPASTLQDLYKLLYQATLGPDHLLTGSKRDSARQYLKQEWSQLDADPRGQILEPIGLQEPFYRLHLRPFKARKLPIEAVWEAVLQTAGQTWGSQAQLRNNWQVLTAAIQEELFPYSVAEAEGWLQALDREGFPALGHTDLYRGVYRPAYRVVHESAIQAFLPELLATEPS